MNITAPIYIYPILSIILSQILTTSLYVYCIQTLPHISFFERKRVEWACWALTQSHTPTSPDLKIGNSDLEFAF